MKRRQPTDELNPADKISCPHCHRQLPLRAVFCSFCGKRIKKVGDWQIDIAETKDKAQETDVDTVRLAPVSDPRKRMTHSQPSRLSGNSRAPEQPYLSDPLLQAAATPEPSLLETVPPEPDLADVGVQRETSVPGGPSQPLPTTPVPSIPEAWQQIPDTEVPASVTARLNWLWPVVIILSALAAGLFNFVFTNAPIRPLIVSWFLLVCPGMALVRFLRLREPVIEWVLAIVLSFAIEALAATIELATGRWSPAATLTILIGLSLGGAIVRLAIIYLMTPLPVIQLFWKAASPGNKVFRPVVMALKLYPVNPLSKGFSNFVSKRKITPSLPGLPRTTPTRNRRVLVPILLILLISIIVGTSLWFYTVYHSSRSTSSPPTLAKTTSPHSSIPSTVISTPSSTSAANLAELYYGTIYNIAANITTNMSLTGIRQTRLTISGNFTGLYRTGIFNGIFDPSKHLQFTVKDSAGRLIFSFNGNMQSDGELSGNFCSVDQKVQCTGDFGLWSVAPTP